VLFRWVRLSVSSKQGDVTRIGQPLWYGEVWVGKDWHRFQDLGAHRGQ
jgi:hypothetical protein